MASGGHPQLVCHERGGAGRRGEDIVGAGFPQWTVPPARARGAVPKRWHSTKQEEELTSYPRTPLPCSQVGSLRNASLSPDRLTASRSISHDKL